MNAKSECENLDAFLSEELDAVAAARFDAHLSACATCREAIDEQRWIDTLLRSSAKIESESRADSIVESLRTTIVRRRRNAKFAACGLAAAAMLLLAAGWTIQLNRQARVPAVPEVAQFEASPQPTGVQLQEPPRATFVTNGESIAVPLESPAADVTVVQLIPTTDTESRWRRELVLRINYPELNGG